MFNNSNDNHAGSGEYIIFDCEFAVDRPLYERYRRADPDPAPCRWPMKRVMSVSVMAGAFHAG